MAEIQFDDQVDITDKVCPLTFVKAKVQLPSILSSNMDNIQM